MLGSPTCSGSGEEGPRHCLRDGEDYQKLDFTCLSVLGVPRPSLMALRQLRWEEKETLLGERAGKFVRAVDGALRRHAGAGVGRFGVCFCLHREHQEHLDRWVRFAVESGAEELNLVLKEGALRHAQDPCRFPPPFLAGPGASRLRRLHLCYLRWTRPAPPDIGPFGSLAALELVEVGISHEDLHNILSRCPVLERLRVRRCDEVMRIRICPSSPLKCLCIEGCRRLKRIELSALDLNRFKFAGPARTLVGPVDVPNLQSVSISFESVPGTSDVTDFSTLLLRRVPHLGDLYLGFHRVLERQDLLLFPRGFSYLKNMVVAFEGWADEDLLWIASLLTIAPFLEKLRLDLLIIKSSSGRGGNSCSLGFSHKHLREVTISGFTGLTKQMQLANFILHHTTLEVMKININNFYVGEERWIYEPITGEEAESIRCKALQFLSTNPSNARLVIT